MPGEEYVKVENSNFLFASGMLMFTAITLLVALSVMVVVGLSTGEPLAQTMIPMSLFIFIAITIPVSKTIERWDNDRRDWNAFFMENI